MDRISQELESQLSLDSVSSPGPVAAMAANYTLESDRLLGLVLKLDFAESHIVTCDPWKRKCRGVPRGSLVLFRVDPRAVDLEDRPLCNRLILARVTDAVPTPVEGNVQQTLFQVHKLQAQLDPLTNMDLQWGALKASILGTYFDDGDRIGFGNDVDTFFSAFAYVTYSPTEEDLARLINAFVEPTRAVEIGQLRYTETVSAQGRISVPITIDPRDIVGENNAAQRLANFGKTRFGKSNSTKIISRTIFESDLNVAQVFFDPSGEYTYINDQDRTSLFALYSSNSVRYALAPKALRLDEQRLGLQPPQPLKVNFYDFPQVGHSLITGLWSTENQPAPLYMRPVLDWAAAENIPNRTNFSAFNHYWRTMAIWWAILHRADFASPPSKTAPIDFPDSVKQQLAQLQGVALDSQGNFDTRGQPVRILPTIFDRVWRLYQADQALLAAAQTPTTRRTARGSAAASSGAQSPISLSFPPSSSTGEPYFNEVEVAMLRVVADKTIGGPRYLRPFNKYHDFGGSSIFEDIAAHVSNGRSVFIDMSQANELVRNNLVDRICRSLYRLQNDRFNSEEGLDSRFVLFHFEEAHRLFRSDDKDMNSIYNILAKEGAKLNIAMAYSTQSMTTISPDLIKNTDNFLIGHLDDDREAREVARKYVFRDLSDDVQRIQSKGYVRMITRSHKFALPVQILKFGPR